VAQICILSSVHIALDNRIFYREAVSLQQAGHDVTVIAIHEQNEVRNGIQIIGLPLVPRWQRPLLWCTLLRQARKIESDVYHFHDPELLIVSPWLRLLTGKPVIYDVHESYADFILVKDYLPALIRYPFAWVFRRLEPWLARLQSALVFADDQIASSFHGVDCPKATLFNFPAVSFLESADSDIWGSGQRQATILYLGGLERNRGSKLMIEALYLVRQCLPDVRLLLVGHFMPLDLEQEICEEARKFGIESALIITGKVAFEQIGVYLNQATVGWITWQAVEKNEKNIPTKLFEYMAYGLPVVSSDLASTRPYVNEGENGCLVTAGTPKAHAEAIVQLLSSPESAVAMGKRGQKLVRDHWNWDKMEKRLLMLYQELL